MEVKTEMDLNIAAAADKVMYGSAGSAVFGWMASNELLIAVSLVTVVVGFFCAQIFRFRADVREQKLNRARLNAVVQREKLYRDIQKRVANVDSSPDEKPDAAAPELHACIRAAEEAETRFGELEEEA